MGKKIANCTQPKTSIKNSTQVIENDIVSIDIQKYQNWLYSVKVNEFTNMFLDGEQAGKYYYRILTEIFPHLKQCDRNILQSDHCHRLGDKQKTLAIKIIKEIHRNVKFDEDDLNANLCSLGVTNGIRIIASVSVSNVIHIVPLFVDEHHLLYPSKKYNSADYKKYSYIPQR